MPVYSALAVFDDIANFGEHIRQPQYSHDIITADHQQRKIRLHNQLVGGLTQCGIFINIFILFILCLPSQIYRMVV